MNRGGDVESYVWIKVILLDMPRRIGGGGGELRCKMIFMNEILLGLWRFRLSRESLSTKRLKHLYICRDAKREDSRLHMRVFQVVAFS